MFLLCFGFVGILGYRDFVLSGIASPLVFIPMHPQINFLLFLTLWSCECWNLCHFIWWKGFAFISWNFRRNRLTTREMLMGWDYSSKLRQEGLFFFFFFWPPALNKFSLFMGQSLVGWSHRLRQRNDLMRPFHSSRNLCWGLNWDPRPLLKFEKNL